MRHDDHLEPTGWLDVPSGPLEVADLPAARGADDLAPLVLLHEGLGSVRLWRGFPAALHAGSGRRTAAYSRAGYGGSPVLRGPRGVGYLHDEAQVVLPAALTALGAPRPVLVGHSDGASIALIAAGCGAADPAALVLLAPHVIVEDVTIAGLEATRTAYATTDLPQRLARHHTDADATFRGWNDVWLSPAFRSWDIRDLLGGVRCPVLLLQGVDDGYATMAQLDEIERGVAGPVRRVEIPACGHAPHLEQPEATTAAVLAFLDELGRGAQA